MGCCVDIELRSQPCTWDFSFESNDASLILDDRCASLTLLDKEALFSLLHDEHSLSLSDAELMEMVLRGDAEHSFSWKAESYQLSLDEDAVDAVFSLAEELRIVDFVLSEGMKADYQMHDRKCVFEFKEVCAPLVDMWLIVTPMETQWITDMDSITYEVDSNVDWIIE